MMTEAQKRAIYAYRERMKGTDRGEQMRLKQNAYVRKSEKKRYDNDEEHRLSKIKNCLENYYDKQYYSYDRITKLFRRILL